MAQNTIGIKFFIGDEELTNLLEIPELANGETDTIEITTLADEYHKFTDGLKNFSDTIGFKFIFEKQQFSDLSVRGNTEAEYKVVMPDGFGCRFTGKGSVKLDAISVGGYYTYIYNVKPTSVLEWYQEA